MSEQKLSDGPRQVLSRLVALESGKGIMLLDKESRQRVGTLVRMGFVYSVNLLGMARVYCATPAGRKWAKKNIEVPQ